MLSAHLFFCKSVNFCNIILEIMHFGALPALAYCNFLSGLFELAEKFCLFTQNGASFKCTVCIEKQQDILGTVMLQSIVAKNAIF